MKYLIFLAFFAPSIISAENKATEISVTQLDKNRKGKLRFMVFREGKEFPREHDAAILTKIVDTNGQETVRFTVNLPQGTYALKVLHDENENGKVDKKMIFIPSEGIGFSKDIKMTYRPPYFREAKINTTNIKPVEIKMYYY